MPETKVCPVCERPVPTFEPGEVGPFCTPITCSAWRTTAVFNHDTRQWDDVRLIDGQETP